MTIRKDLDDMLNSLKTGGQKDKCIYIKQEILSNETVKTVNCSRLCTFCT